MVAMAAMMGGTMRSPLTGIFFMLELTHDLNALPALLCGSVAALGVTVLIMKRSILTEKLARRGQHIAREYSVDLFELMRVADVMDKDFFLLPATTPLRKYSARIANGDPLICSHQGTLLVDEQANWRESLPGEILSAHLNAPGMTHSPCWTAGSTDLVVTYPEETLHDAIAKLLRHDIGRLPVVEQSEPTTVVGYLGRAGILAARERYHQEEDIRQRGTSIRRTGQTALTIAEKESF